jgi:hypothetical protein
MHNAQIIDENSRNGYVNHSYVRTGKFHTEADKYLLIFNVPAVQSSIGVNSLQMYLFIILPAGISRRHCSK